jgi:hypothetical protein
MCCRRAFTLWVMRIICGLFEKSIFTKDYQGNNRFYKVIYKNYSSLFSGVNRNDSKVFSCLPL